MADQKGIPEIQLTATASRPLGQLQQHAKWDTYCTKAKKARLHDRNWALTCVVNPAAA